MEELDLLKKAWKKDTHSYEQVSESEIYNMLHRKSSSIVKWILIISILEFALWALFSILFNTEEAIKNLHAENFAVYLKILTYVNYVVVVLFIFSFYRNYAKISTITSTKQLMQDIIRTRKTVQYYVWYNLFMIFISTILGFVMAFVYNPEMAPLKYKIAHEDSYYTLTITICMIVATVVVFVGGFWLIYRLLYGILLRKLNANYKELKKIDL
ncbi:hypothetical protein HKT18_08405 [Flavobacterium sp. IMCC34852]|uniref:Beta-carotene 15,15'-monooxygenase n=1 Tax=Flavobacterium rivulicola TaxID=2732161 RepID=A0A7Y3RA32_9FLAO|nr:hypothetical protein [Flavobacterium sp. IMCC34852]NNT72231.1 hypothetical protein [Flavobacterium sp. IMCC34852]